MRTTLTLDPDVAAEVERLRHESGLPLREVINNALRAGLVAQSRAEPVPFTTRAVSLGRPTLPNLDDIAGVLDEFGDEAGR